MDAELIAIQRVKRAVKGLPEPAQLRVLNYVVQGMYEAQQQDRFYSGSNQAQGHATGLLTTVPRLSEAN